MNDLTDLPQSYIDDMYCFVTGFSELTSRLKSAYLDALISISKNLLEGLEACCDDQDFANTLKIYFYFFAALINKIDSPQQSSVTNATKASAGTIASVTAKKPAKSKKFSLLLK